MVPAQFLAENQNGEHGKDDQGNEMVLFDINPRETWDTLVYKITLVSKK